MPLEKLRVSRSWFGSLPGHNRKQVYQPAGWSQTAAIRTVMF
jgi:hypothetical protein